MSFLSLCARLTAAAQSAAGVVFVDRQERDTFVPYRDLLTGALRQADALRARGVQPGERVAIVLPSGPAFYHALFGALWCGAIAVPMYPPVRLGKLDDYLTRTEGMLHDVRVSVVLTSEPIAQLLRGAMANAQVTRGWLSAIERVCGGPAAPSSPVTPSADDIALLQFSSGTTSRPKAVALTHRHMAANIDVMIGAINTQVPAPRAESRHVTVSWLPLYHDMGLMGCVLGALSDASTLVLLPPELFVARPAAWLRALSRHRGSVSAAPNFAYGLCAARVSDDELHGVDLSHWRVALNGAEAVSAQTMQQFARRFAGQGFDGRAFAPVYGLAEATLAVTFSPLGQGARVGACGAVSVGHALPGYDVRIVPGDDAATGAFGEAIGQIEVRGPSVCDGYWQGDAVVPAAHPDGFFPTGDLGFVRDGQLYVTGRQKDVLVVRGKNLAPEPLERAADAVPGVRVGCVVAVAHRRLHADTDDVLMLVETRQRGRAARGRLRAAVASAVAAQTGLTVAQVVLLAPGTLPRTSSGKLRRRAALEAYVSKRLTAPARLLAPRIGWRLWAGRLAARVRTAWH